MTIKMTRDEFWDAVEAVNWSALVAEEKACEGRPKVGERAEEKGRAILLELLPTRAHMRAYDAHMMEVYNDICTALHEYNETLSDPEWLGGDSTSDLIDHIVGLGRTEYDRVTADPSLALARFRCGDFWESFAYCAPSHGDYNPIETKLAREISGLTHWQEELERKPDYKTAQSEVEWRSRAVAKLQEAVSAAGGSVMTPDEAEALLEAARAQEDAMWEALRAFDRETRKLQAILTNEFAEERALARQALIESFDLS